MSGAVPSWTYEKTEVYPPDPGWAGQGVAECARLSELLAPWLIDGVEHVGSTAVPGLAAKPIIDVMASVTDPDLVVEQASQRLATGGWCPVPPELDRRPWRRFFVKPDISGQRRVAHLHVIRCGHPRWFEQIAFRDALRDDDELARRYEALKCRLAEQYGYDRERYAGDKAEFISHELSQRPGPNAG